MSVEYDVFKTPKPKGGSSRQRYHARLVPNGNVARINELALLISEISSFSSGDVSGMLKALQEVMSLLLLRGRKVELEGLGLFSVTLETRRGQAEGEEVVSIAPKTVKFRCSAELRERIRTMKLGRTPRNAKKVDLPFAERKDNLLSYLRSNEAIVTSEYAALNHCNRYTALKDIKELLREGMIKNIGFRRTSAYSLNK